MNAVEKYIEDNWKKCIRENRFDVDTLIGVPYPYTVPSAEAFDELYYWDTYFTNLGLIKAGRAMLAKNNTDNILYMVDKYGFMPNGTRIWYLTRSQPPFLSEMVKDIYEYYKDIVWLSGAYSVLCKEYAFWMKERISKIGLNHYDYDKSIETDAADFFESRIGKRISDIPRNLITRHALATAESGWDMNPRWDFEAYNFAPVELNSLLYGMEKNMEYFAQALGYIKESAEWNDRACKRKELMNSCMLNKEQLFFDYNFENQKLSKIFSAASFFPLYMKVASAEQAEALVKSIARLEERYGIVACEKNNSDILYQWDYPNGWACLHYVAVKGLLNYGYIEEAKRIGEKYIHLVERVFDETGAIWEKYNVVEGNVNVTNEYHMPTMLGWSAGTYLAIANMVR